MIQWTRSATHARQARVLARLEHDRAVAQRYGLADTGGRLFAGHPVTGDFAVGRPQSAIAAEPDAVVGYLDQAAEMHLAADVHLPRLVRQLPESGQTGLVRLAEPTQNLVVGHAAKGLRVAGDLAIYYTGCGSNASRCENRLNARDTPRPSRGTALDSPSCQEWQSKTAGCGGLQGCHFSKGTFGDGRADCGTGSESEGGLAGQRPARLSRPVRQFL